MRKSLKRLGICALIVCLVWAAGIVSNKQLLQNGLIRLHVVAASDSETDQNLKLLVRDAVIRSLRENMDHVKDMEEAKAYLRENLPKIEALANGVLQNAGIHDTVTVSLRPEEFGTRVYDTFTLPAGVYDALRIVIGEGQGKNWWCVVFPGLCIPAASEDAAAVAAGAGFPEGLNNTLIGEEGYELRFGILDAMGKLENLFFGE